MRRKSYRPASGLTITICGSRRNCQWLAPGILDSPRLTSAARLRSLTASVNYEMNSSVAGPVRVWLWLLAVLAGALLTGCVTERIDWPARIGNYSFDQAIVEF